MARSPAPALIGKPTAAGPPPAKLRLFLALWPPAPVRQRLQAWQAQWRWPSRAAVVPGDRLHLTLHFLGAVPRERLDALRAALAVSFTPFELRLGAASLWPRGLAALAPLEIPPPLLALHARLADALRAVELPVEARAFRPHVSLARKAAGALAPARPLALRWPVRRYTLMQSADGYHPLRHYR